MAAHHLVELLLDGLGDLGVSQHVDDTPLEGGLDCLHTRGEEVADHLLDLSVRIAAAEHLASLGSALLYLKKVRVYEVSDVGWVERLPVVVHRLLEELRHLTAIL